MILGISAYYHDSAAALVDGLGRISAAAQEERFTRRRHTAEFPAQAAAWSLNACGCDIDKLSAIVYYESPPLKAARLLDGFLSAAKEREKPFEDAIPEWLSRKAYLKRTLLEELKKLGAGDRVEDLLHFVPHHAAHAASAFFPSPWPEALVVSIDGVGEYASCSVSIGSGATLKPLREIRFPHSLGLVYSALTFFCGFKVNSGEYKLMGLAPYGKPVYADRIKRRIVKANSDGSFRVASELFDEFAGELMVSPALDEIFDGPPLPQGSQPGLREANIAASIQVALEDVLVNLVGSMMSATGLSHVCMAGGVALNCVANATLLRSLPLKGLWIQPAAGDAGGALGAALLHFHSALGNPRKADGRTDSMKGAFLGPSYGDDGIAAELDKLGATYERLDKDALIERCSKLLSEGATLAWFQGAMEFGPRALGARSILADPRSKTAQRDLNLKIKKRESFRPFAPAVLKEFASQWFDLKAEESPYMLLTAPVLESRRLEGPPAQAEGDRLRVGVAHSVIPAVTHVDYSARVQTVDKATNPLFHALISKFSELTGCPLLLNTSFNVRGEPIVCTPSDAFVCFMNAEVDFLAIGNFLLSRVQQDPLAALSCARSFEPD